jgi:ureidoglycolate lyase
MAALPDRGPSMSRLVVSILALTPEAFAPYGDVIQIGGSQHYTINNGYAERYHDLAAVDVMEQGGRPLISIFHATPRALPVRIQVMERHPMSSQAFFPLSTIPFLVVVAAPGDDLSAESLRAFITDGRQGINYRRGVWHHALLALETACDFLVVDRGGPGKDCDEVSLGEREIVLQH